MGAARSAGGALTGDDNEVAVGRRREASDGERPPVGVDVVRLRVENIVRVIGGDRVEVAVLRHVLVEARELFPSVPSVSIWIVSAGTVATPVTQKWWSGEGSPRPSGKLAAATCPSVAPMAGIRTLKESVRSWTLISPSVL